MPRDFLGFLLVVVVAFAVHWLFVTRRQGMWNVDSLAVVYYAILAVGTLYIPLDASNAADREYAWVVTVPLVIYVCVSIVHFRLTQPDPIGVRPGLNARQVDFVGPRGWVLWLGLLAAAVTTLYFIALGSNAFLIGIWNAIGGTVTEDFQQLRAEAYSGSKYLFPGYVNQFKNCILPAISIVAVAHLYAHRHRHRVVLSALILAGTIVGVLGNGQRGPFVLVLLTLVIFVFHVQPQRFRKRALVIGAIGLPVFVLTTYVNGRSQADFEQADGAFNKLLVLLDEVVRRAFLDNQEAGQYGFRYTRSDDIAPGSDWAGSFMGVLPGNPGTDLPSKIYEIMFGTDAGTAPPSLWGSVEYNFGWVGLIVVPAILAVVYRTLTNLMITSDEVNTVEVIGYSGFSAVAGAWIAGGPEYLLNAGAVAFALLWWGGRRMAADDGSARARGAGSIGLPALLRAKGPKRPQSTTSHSPP